jgi:hypothetical protein
MRVRRADWFHNVSQLAFASLIALPLAGWSVAANAIPFVGGNEVTDYNFDSTPNGSTPPTAAPGANPQHDVYSIGGYPDSGTLTGGVTVQDASTMSHAAVMNTTQGGTGSLFIDTQFNTTGNKISTSFDVAILAMPTTGLPQDAAHAPNGQGFVVQAFGNGPLAQNRVFRFVATPTGATGGSFGLRNNTDGDIIVIGSYELGQTYHIQIDADFLSQTIDAYIDDSLAANDLAFVDPTTNIYEDFIFQNGVEGETNTAAIDNLVTYDNITAFGSVPEPITLALMGAGLGGIAMGRRRKAK